MADTTPTSVAIATHDNRLRIEFHWREDRFAHQIILDGEKIGSSVEGDADEPWPASPPLQQLSREEIDGGQVILGVGAAGRSHWSLSVEVESETPAIRFDLAARCTPNAGFLGSTYLLSDSLVLSPTDGATVGDQSAADGSITVQPVPESGETRRWAYRLCLKTT